MFDLVHENKRLVQLILLLIILPFTLWGVNSYRQSGGDALATVAGEKITQAEFDNALRRQLDYWQQRTHGRVNPAAFDTPENKREILNDLIDFKLLGVKGRSVGLTLSDEQLAQIIAANEAFQTDGMFDSKKYEAVLRNQGLSPAVYQASETERAAASQMAALYSENGYASNAGADYLIRVNEQQRIVSVAQIAPDAFMNQAKVEDAEVKKYYDNNPQEFAIPERARVDYVLFSAASLLPQVKVDPDEVKKYYAEHEGEFTTGAEQRHAAHILITAPAAASEADKKAAREKAESILKEVKQAPGQFAVLAKKFSADPGSAAKGGDLGFFGRGMMVKPFEDAAFSMKPGEISQLVQTDYGFHIIKLLEVKEARTKPLTEVQADLTQKLKLQKARDRFAELADKFGNTVYEQSDSLKPAAELAQAQVQQSGWLAKGQQGTPPFTDKALQAVFSEDVLKKKRNSSAVEIAPDTLLAVRLAEYKPADTQPFGEVREAIKKKLMLRQAAELAAKQGQSILAQLQHGETAGLKWAAAQTITRSQKAGLDPELAIKALKADVGKLPAYVGMESAQGGYMLARVDAVKEAGPIDDAKRDNYLQQVRRLTGDELLKAYLANAKSRASISVKAFPAAGKS